LIQYNNRNDIAVNECVVNNGTLTGVGCETPRYVLDVFLLSTILFSSTYVISLMLKDFKTSSFFPTKFRQIVSDFAVVIAIASMSILDNLIGLETPKLYVPDKFKVFLFIFSSYLNI
jgi:sodium bicarbonate transporter 10